MNSQPPRISVIMPVYNGSPHLEQSITSILNQTFADFEFIVVEDCSQDDSLNILRSFAQKDARIRVIENEKNMGIANSRNTAILIARGEFIAVIDQDDVSLPQRFEKQFDFLSRHPEIGICGTQYSYLADGNTLECPELPQTHAQLFSSLLFFCPFVHSSIIFKREPFIQKHIFYDPDFAYAQDYELWSRALPEINAVNLPDNLTLIRLHPEQASQKYRSEQMAESLRVIRRLLIRLGVLYSERDLELHFAIHWHIVENTPELLQQVQTWFDKLQAANNLAHFFPEPEFSQELNRHFERLSREWSLAMPDRETLPAESARHASRLSQVRAWLQRSVIGTHFYLSMEKIKRRSGLEQDCSLVSASGLFDPAWYLSSYPDVARAGMDTLLHFVVIGGLEGRDPGPNFSSAWYLDENEDVRQAGINPLVHYLAYGKKEGRLSHSQVQPKVSVVMPFLNSKKFLAEAIESVIAQSFTDWELLLVDDGSSDGSSEIAQSYARQNPQQVRCLAHDGRQNRGTSASRNLAARHARGELIAYLDSDDVWLPQKLEQHISILTAHPDAEAVFGETLYWYSWTKDPQDRLRNFTWNIWKRFGFEPNTLANSPRLVKPLLEHQVMPVPSGLVIRREALARIGGWEEQFSNMFDDQAFYLKLFLHASVFVASDCLEMYRQHPDSLCSVAQQEGKTSAYRKFFLAWAEGYLSSQNFRDVEIDQLLQHILTPQPDPILIRISPLLQRFLMGPFTRLTRRNEPSARPGQPIPDHAAQRNLSPAYEGYLDSVDQNVITGWAWNANQPDRAIGLDFYFDSLLLFSTTAGQFRQDLVDAGKGSGCHAFEVQVPSKLRNGKNYSLDVRISGTDTSLSQSPQMVKWPLQILADVRDFHSKFKKLLARLMRPFVQLLPRRKPSNPEAAQAPAVGKVDFGNLRRTVPISKTWGYDRGKPIDRYYIEHFFYIFAADVHGRVLEIGDSAYTRTYGGSRVTHSDVLNINAGVEGTTILADLTDAPHIPSDTFDCIIITQTLQFIYDTNAALNTLHRILKPGGVLLATFPGISQTYDVESGDSSYWSFTRQSAALLFERIFKPRNLSIQTYGNVLAAAAFLYGLAVEELDQNELDTFDPGYSLIIGVRAVK